jgi:predicted transcriptional regulator
MIEVIKYMGHHGTLATTILHQQKGLNNKCIKTWNEVNVEFKSSSSQLT